MSRRETTRPWTHKSVLALMKGGQSDDPEKLIREKAQAKVAWARTKGWSGPPFNPQLLASLLGIQVREAGHLFSEEAQLTPIAGRQLLLEFNPDRAQGRRNYSIFHEIAHTLFDDCFEMVHQRRTNPARYGPESEVEQLCQIAAAEMLMPEADFCKELARRRFSLKAIRPLMDCFEASREAVLRRMVNLGDRPCAIVFFSSRLSPVEKRQARQGSLIEDARERPVPRMRILYTVTSDDFPVFLPHHKSAPDGSCVYQLSEVDEIVSRNERWEIPGFGAWDIEATLLPVPATANDKTPTAAALVLPKIAARKGLRQAKSARSV
jgi:Zn-dependent peptidase ImmA (M78 family)